MRVVKSYLDLLKIVRLVSGRMVYLFSAIRPKVSDLPPAIEFIEKEENGIERQEIEVQTVAE
jgi:hypothetical protein